MTGAIKIHPQNPKLFEFRSRPLALVTATEHYGAVMNRPFDFESYLADVAEKRITLTRLFTLFRELPDGIEGEPAAGSVIEGSLVLRLQAASYRARCFDPNSGRHPPAVMVAGGAPVRLELPSFTDDLAVRVKRVAQWQTYFSRRNPPGPASHPGMRVPPRRSRGLQLHPTA